MARDPFWQRRAKSSPYFPIFVPWFQLFRYETWIGIEKWNREVCPQRITVEVGNVQIIPGSLVKFQQRYQMRHRNSRSVGAISRRSQELAAIVEQTLTQDVRALLESLLTQEPVEGTSVPGKTSASRIPPAGRRFSTR